MTGALGCIAQAQFPFADDDDVKNEKTNSIV